MISVIPSVRSSQSSLTCVCLNLSQQTNLAGAFKMQYTDVLLPRLGGRHVIRFVLSKCPFEDCSLRSSMNPDDMNDFIYCLCVVLATRLAQ